MGSFSYGSNQTNHIVLLVIDRVSVCASLFYLIVCVCNVQLFIGLMLGLEELEAKDLGTRIIN